MIVNIAIEMSSYEGENKGVANVEGPLQLSDLENKHRHAERFGLALFSQWKFLEMLKTILTDYFSILEKNIFY